MLARVGFAARTRFVMIFAALALSGCNLFLRDTPTPIPTRVHPWAASARAETLIVFLPGRGDTLGTYEQEGFLATMHEAGVKADAIIVDAHMGYYFKRSVVKRLRADVLLPARQQGYRRIVMVGTSLGGLGSLLLERDNPGSADALVLLSPYLGEKDQLFDAIEHAGGPAAWAAGRDPHAGSIEEQIWTFLGTKSPMLPPTWLRYGQEDKYVRGHRLFEKLLPANRVKSIPGDHDWPTWRALWREICFDCDVFQSERR